MAGDSPIKPTEILDIISSVEKLQENQHVKLFRLQDVFELPLGM